MDFLKHHHHRHSSATSHRSISDTDSQLDEFHSPLRADSPLRSADIISSTSTSTAIVTVDKFRSPIRSPLSRTVNVAPLAKSPSPAVTYNRPAKDEAVTGGTVKSGSGGGDAGFSGGDGGVKRSRVPVTPVVRRQRSEVTVERVALGFRICEMIFCLIAFSVMVSDKTQGWSGDSFDRYMEYKYLVAVNVIAFTYAALQAVDHTYLLVYGRHVVTYPLRCHFDFLIDQILAYLLISSSSSAATRVDDWVLNWGKDEFTKMASASVVMSFLAFLGFAFSSIISGYNVCDKNPI
ncbi:putative casparian strip membrane protein [Helianthus annuus]|uniref:CASP-like protein n=1 Tax=Helianthus annuus TaxID=4232 RepID=A0A251TJ66_HELAN|nr:CASP-like protein 4A3 [Helianthus annuus]KAF5807123.1 putative casparian strip membrane protein [Helianthus annuus]KAJ0585648.1 putative casparian strip membrane protein [Helianthus annuus]KAJ0920238.1 putative casparian strip membrane protein [Helianthus annuus]KAJ0923886.1 putative casparian strip membrane protein [Helianthus annuus]